MPKFDWLPDKLLDVLGDPHTANNVLKFSGYVTFVSRLVDELVPHCNYLPKTMTKNDAVSSSDT